MAEPLCCKGVVETTMGLDAFVYCNCYETGRHKTPPPQGIEIEVSPDGSINCAHETVDAAIAIYAWTHQQACDHEDCTFLHHYIGNIAFVAFLRETLQRNAEKFPTILSKVIYNGIHGGDYLTLQQVNLVREELAHFSSVACDNEEDQQYLDTFRGQLTELVNCALELQKPIAF
ncbi:hypothetical protein [Acaryochloris marina]|uniref:hypothetical protein n=1 Tax=Acaryochloris marina TaxID=155978 RepID=UPI001BAF401C|nr:hypothetical protein [Acaryochloris marina]QUY43149.1 hypothetical protein I1H34_03045 [Acaryochloris marina S15]